MAHELETRDGKASMAYAKSGGVPWHGLGAAGDESWTSDDWKRESGTDYRVLKQKNFYLDGASGNYVPTGQFSLSRDTDGAFYGNCSKGWNPIQPETARDFMWRIAEATGSTMETMGALKSGQIMFALLKLKKGAFSVMKGDTIEPYLLFANPHIVGKAWSVRATNIRTVCFNTYTAGMAIEAQTEVRGSHLETFDADMAAKALALSTDAMAKFKEHAELLAKRRIKDEGVVAYFKRVFDLKELKGATAGEKAANVRTQKQIDQLKQILVTQPGAEFGKGTVWQAFNAVTYYADHVASKSTDSRLNSAWFGQNAMRKQNAMKFALELAA